MVLINSSLRMDAIIITFGFAVGSGKINEDLFLSVHSAFWSSFTV
jgi:hypothetical protein